MLAIASNLILFIFVSYAVLLQYEMEELIDRNTSDICCNGGDAIDTTHVARSHSPMSSSLAVETGGVCLDTKGGEQGALPSGRDKYVRLAMQQGCN